jgi:hypothetical protein
MVVSSGCARRPAVAGVEQREAAGAVGRLHHARREAGLADVAACWSPAMPRIGMARRRTDVGLGRAEVGGAVAHLRQQRRGMRTGASSSSSQRRVRMSKSSVRAALVASVACTRRRSAATAGSCRRCRRRARPLGRRARAGPRVEQPGDLGGRRNRGRAAARCARDQRLVAGRAQARAQRRRCAGPARRWRCGSACRWRGPRQRGLALVGDADGGDVPAPGPRQTVATRRSTRPDAGGPPGRARPSHGLIATSRRRTDTPVTSSPSMTIEPDDGRSSPAISRSSVVLPERVGPSRTLIASASKVRVASAIWVSLSTRLVTFLSSSAIALPLKPPEPEPASRRDAAPSTRRGSPPRRW